MLQSQNNFDHRGNSPCCIQSTDIGFKRANAAVVLSPTGFYTFFTQASKGAFEGIDLDEISGRAVER